MIPTASLMRTRSDCRLCGSTDLDMVMSLGATPLANAFVTAEERGKQQPHFPLDVYMCKQCSHVQLRDIVQPEVLFRNYVYVSGTSPVFVEHFRRYAESVLTFTGMPRGSRVVEIGSNDGTLLRFFQEAGMQVQGVDPARAIADSASRAGIPTLPEFFDEPLAARLRTEGGEAAAVIANNVFAHADDLHGIVAGVRQLLATDGVFVFEVSYLMDVVEKTLFDTIYHEHLSYHTVKPLLGLFERHDMQVIEALRVEPHGGSLRCMVGHKGGRFQPNPQVMELVAQEEALGLHDGGAYRALFRNIQQRKQTLRDLLADLKRQHRKIAGFGAPAKACTLMHHFELDADTLEYIIDDSPLKQGLYSPGHHIPVVDSSYLYQADKRPDYAVILAWNFAPSIMQKHQAYLQQGGHFVVPLPQVETF